MAVKTERVIIPEYDVLLLLSLIVIIGTGTDVSPAKPISFPVGFPQWDSNHPRPHAAL